MLEREIKDFVRATLAVQALHRCMPDQAKAEVARILGCNIPSEAEFNAALNQPVPRRQRGRPRTETLSKRDAVAAVAVYFETLGAGAEQAISDARHWLSVPLSRKVAKAAVKSFKTNTAPDQFKAQAVWAYGVFRPGTTQPLPDRLTPKRKRRKTKSDLG